MIENDDQLKITLVQLGEFVKALRHEILNPGSPPWLHKAVQDAHKGMIEELTNELIEYAINQPLRDEEGFNPEYLNR